MNDVCFRFQKKKKIFDQRPWTTSENQRGPKTRQNSGPLSLWSHLKRKNKPKQRKGHVTQLKVLKWDKVPTLKGPRKWLESGQLALVHP